MAKIFNTFHEKPLDKWKTFGYNKGGSREEVVVMTLDLKSLQPMLLNHAKE